MNLSDFIKIIFDKDKSIGQKAMIFSLILIFLFMFDLSFNFSFDNHYSTKLSNLEKIVSLKESYKLDSIKLIQIYNYENSILNNKHYSEFLSDFILSIHLNSSDIEAKQSSAEKNEDQIKKRIIWHFIFSIISSSIVPIIVLIFAIILFPFGFLLKENSFFLGWAGIFSISLLLTLLLSFVSLLIPIIFGLPIVNYLLNILIQIGLLYFIMNKIIR